MVKAVDGATRVCDVTIYGEPGNKMTNKKTRNGLSPGWPQTGCYIHRGIGVMDKMKAHRKRLLV
jgi:hypothetical protein